jgi:hypothetical protein
MDESAPCRWRAATTAAGAEATTRDSLPAGLPAMFPRAEQALRTTAVSAMQELELFGQLTTNGCAFIITQEPDPIYSAIGVDGFSVTEFSADYPNVQIDISDSDGTTTVQRLYAWYKSILMSADELLNFYGFLTPDDIVNYKLNDIKLENVTVNPLILTGGRLYRTDGTTVICVSSGPIQIDPGKAYIANMDAINLDLSRIKKNTNLVPALL